MFVCSDCHTTKVDCKSQHLLYQSNGPCEICGLIKNCFDCKIGKVLSDSDIVASKLIRDLGGTFRARILIKELFEGAANYKLHIVDILNAIAEIVNIEERFVQ